VSKNTGFTGFSKKLKMYVQAAWRGCRGAAFRFAADSMGVIAGFVLQGLKQTTQASHAVFGKAVFSSGMFLGVKPQNFRFQAVCFRCIMVSAKIRIFQINVRVCHRRFLERGKETAC
jgi:hypothetical protein